MDVMSLFTALLFSRGISTPSLQAQGKQRRSSYFNNHQDIARKAAGRPRLYRHFCSLDSSLRGMKRYSAMIATYSVIPTDGIFDNSRWSAANGYSHMNPPLSSGDDP